MFGSQREKWADPQDPQIIALVELDMKKMRVRIVLAREAIKERLRELEYPRVSRMCRISAGSTK
jgi:hypothetical protein